MLCITLIEIDNLFDKTYHFQIWTVITFIAFPLLAISSCNCVLDLVLPFWSQFLEVAKLVISCHFLGIKLKFSQK